MGLSAEGMSRLRIQHNGHSAKTGDTVTISGIKSDISGINKNLLNKTHEISDSFDGAYDVLVPSFVEPSMNSSIHANLLYRYKECYGVQTASQSELIKNDKYSNDTIAPPIYFNSIKASRVEQKVTTTLIGCSSSSSEFFTTKYFPYDPKAIGLPSYPLLGQKIKDGDYSIVDYFSLPPSNLKAGESGNIGVISNFTDSRRQNPTGKTLMRYEILPHTSQSVFIAIISETFDANNFKMSEMIDYYGKTPSILKSVYSLIRTKIIYNNNRRTEVVVDYTD